MKKKFMMVATIFGILSLGACVDDKESPSVEAVRNAKAKQLEAMAEMYKANGEADLIRANAEKALAEAEAEYQKEQTEQSKQKFAEEIKRIKAETEAELIRLEKEKADNEKDLLVIEDEKLNELYRIYSTGAATLAGLNDDLLGQKIQLKTAESGLISAKAVAKQLETTFTNTIARETAKRDALKALPENNKAALQKQIEEYEAALIPLRADRAVKQDAYNKALKAYNDARPDYNTGSIDKSPIEVVEAAKSIINDYSWGIVNTEYLDLTDTKTYPYYSLVASQVTRERNDITSGIASIKQQIGKAEVGTDPATGMYAALKTLMDARDQAKSDYDAAVSGGQSEQQIENLRYAWQQAVAQVQNQEKAISDRKADQQELETKLATFNTLVEVFTAKKADYDTAIENLKKLAVAEEDAEAAWDVVNDKYTDTQFLLDAVKNVEAGTEDLARLIADAEVSIADAEEGLAAITNIETAEQAIAFVKEQISILEAKIAAQKVIVNKAKAALDAALA